MTEPETAQPIPDNENESSATTNETEVPETDAEPPPEPWTPERVSEWNAYYDFYVKLAALLLVFMVSCNYVTDTQRLAASEDRAVDRRARMAHQDRRFLVHGRWSAVARYSLAFPVDSCGDLQAGQ